MIFDTKIAQCLASLISNYATKVIRLKLPYELKIVNGKLDKYAGHYLSWYRVTSSPFESQQRGYWDISDASSIVIRILL